MIYTLAGTFLGAAIGLAVLRIVHHHQDRADARRSIAHWNATMERTTGMVWNPITRTYERPPGTLPWKPKMRWYDYTTADVVLAGLVIYANWRLRRKTR